MDLTEADFDTLVSEGVWLVELCVYSLLEI